MRIVFLGTSDYGEPSLRELVRECHEVAAVITQPDRKCGRGLHAAPCAIKQAAKDLGLKVLQPENVNSPDSVAVLKELRPELLIVISYGQILSCEVLSVPSVMPLNIHGSLLPAYRGPAPVNWALINGDTVTGNTLMKVVRKMDAGPVIAQSRHAITPDDDGLTLERKLSLEAAPLLIDGLRMIASGRFSLTEQDEAKVTMAPKLTKTDGAIDWGRDALKVRDQIRGLAGWPGSYSRFKGKLIKIFPPVSADQEAAKASPGTVIAVSKSALRVACGSGHLEITDLQPEGKRRMSVREFEAGHGIKEGDKFLH